jgi:hypothetical protein
MTSVLLFTSQPINRKTNSMNQTTKDHFNEQLRRRNMKMAASIRNMLVRLFSTIKRTMKEKIGKNGNGKSLKY